MNESIDILTKELISEIGKRIRRVRRNKGMSLDALAKRTRFAKSYLSEIETMKKKPPFALEVDLPFLLTGEKSERHAKEISVVRKGERYPSPGPFGSRGYVYESLTSEKAGRLIDAYIVTVGPDFPPEPFIHEGQEFAYALEGTQEFILDGKTYFLEEGDCICFDSDRPHYSRTVGGKVGKVLVVLALKTK